MPFRPFFWARIALFFVESLLIKAGKPRYMFIFLWRWVCLVCGGTHSLKQSLCSSLTTNVCINSTPTVFNTPIETVLALKGQEIAKRAHSEVADSNSVTLRHLEQCVCVCNHACVFCVLLRLRVSHKKAHLSVRLYNKILRQGWMRHA